MKFKCYDVVEIQGKRYVVGEVISYQEFIVDKTIRYDLNDENYKKNWVFPKELSLGQNMVLCPLMERIKNGLPL